MHRDQSQPLFVSSASLPISMTLRLAMLFIVPIVLACNNHYLLCGIGLMFIGLMVIESVTTVKWIMLGLLICHLLFMSLFGYFFLETFNVIQLFKTFACTTVLLWFGSTVSWPNFKRRYLRHKHLQVLASFIDQGVFQGQILIEHVQKRFDALYIRVGSRSVKNIALAIGGGIATSLERASNVADATYLRTQRAPQRTPNHVYLDRCFVHQDDCHILKNISLVSKRGEWIFLGGPSGSGKTTLLKLISGLIKPTFGKVDLNDQLIGFIFQNPDDQFFATTPREDILWGLEARGTKQQEAEETANYWMQQLGITHLADRSLARLSFGEKKRVAFASCLALKPDLLLCDEPTAGLDVLAARELIRLLEDISQKKQCSVIWASHDLTLMPKKISRAYLIKNGCTVFNGPISNALSQQNLMLAGLR